MGFVDFYQLGDALYEYRADGHVYCQVAGSDVWHRWTEQAIKLHEWPKAKAAMFED